MEDKTGGPAFPHEREVSIYELQEGTRNPNRPVFESGMTLRDYFAAHALFGLSHPDNRCDTKENAEIAYKIADAMMEARKK